MVQGKYLTKGKIMGSMMDNIVEYFVDDDDVLTGSMTVMGVTALVTDGTVDGDEFKHKSFVHTPFGDMKVEVEGEVVDDEIVFYIFNKMTRTKFEGHRIEE